ncbi:hypothetical protein [cyanobacterium endosymbiont of Rhopalodia gibberula]|uniref:hypothetical protein n=1 Tax=cyanobacterium endosymbiont of Rhopalodia gibberula TaxID=1763363 RepID=UPI001558B81D|nr:hypothetical protein [cyanobacterium endosymbiont of Rhopalodia gibberula]
MCRFSQLVELRISSCFINVIIYLSLERLSFLDFLYSCRKYHDRRRQLGKTKNVPVLE